MFVEQIERRVGQVGGDAYKSSAKKRKPLSARQIPFNTEEFYELVKTFYDPVNKGFGLEPKFLHPEILIYRPELKV